MKALITAFIFHLTLNPLLYLKGINVLKPYKTASYIWTSLFVLELLMYILVFSFYRSLPPSFVHFARVFGGSWMLMVIYSSSIILVVDIIYLLIKRQLLKPKMILRQFQRTKTIIFFATLSIVISVLIYGRHHFRNPTVNHVNINIEKSGGEYNKIRIVMAGDLHLGYTINSYEAQRMIDFINIQNPDLILLTGDIIDASIEPIIEQDMGSILKQLKAPLGVYACPGNHDYRVEGEEKIEYLNKSGITMLMDSAVLIDNSFYVIGREDWIIEDRLTTEEILNKYNVDRTKPIFLLNHSPYDLSEEVNAKVDLALYGHTHHGQVFPGNIATSLKFEVAHGFKKKDETNIYVTSGLALAGPQHRIGTNSEVAVIYVSFASN